MVSCLEQVDDSRRWLLTQTVATAHQRRVLLGSLGLSGGWRVLDAGCGFGAGALEMAALAPVAVVGVDSDTVVLSHARRAAETAGVGRSGEGATVRFAAGDLYRMAFPDASFDAAVCRFVFQHLRRPAAPAAELARVVRPGGLVCVVDVDDGLSISEPPPSDAFSRLGDALRAAQSGRGGDRYVGRKLAGILDGAGFEPTAVLVLPQAGYNRTSAGDPARQLLLQRFRAEREGIVASGVMGAGEFDRCLRTLEGEETAPTCEIEAHLAVVGRRRQPG